MGFNIEADVSLLEMPLFRRGCYDDYWLLVSSALYGQCSYELPARYGTAPRCRRYFTIRIWRRLLTWA